MAMTILAIAILVLIIMERMPALSWRPARLWRRYFITDIFYLVTGFVIGGALTFSYIEAASRWLRANIALPTVDFASWPAPITVLLALVLIDLGNYIAHLLMHRFDLLWEFHKIHHSSTHLDWLAAFRSHLIEQTLRRVLAPVLLIVAGLPFYAVIIAGGIFTAWAAFNHSNLSIKLGFLEKVIITPSTHRVHHYPQTSQQNLGTIFTIWDRLRGSYTVNKADREALFGNGENNYPQTWTAQLIQPFHTFVRLIPRK